MTWAFLLVLLLPGGGVQATLSEPTTWALCEEARELARRAPLPKGVEGRLIGACREQS